MATRIVFSFVTAILLSSCGGDKSPPKSPEGEAPSGPPAGDGTSEGAEKSESLRGSPSGEEVKKEEPPASAPKVEKPKSESTIGTTSVSDVDSASLQAEVKKLGWLKDSVAAAGGVTGSYESIRFDIEKGKATGYIEIMRPAAHPGPATGAPTPAPSEQKDAKEKDGATWYDETSDVLVVVVVEGKKADAKKLLTQLVKPAKKGAKKPEKPPAAAPAEGATKKPEAPKPTK